MSDLSLTGSPAKQTTSAGRLKKWALAIGVIALVAAPRLTALNGYLIVDEADRWRWAEEFYRALIAGDLRATMIGDGYPGIVPVWLETIWLLGESLRRSVVHGGWLGEEGIYLLFHVWGRTTHLAQQRLPIALFNCLLALLVGWQTGRLYGRRVGLVALVLIALNPFYLADSRVNRAEAVITGLLTLSVLLLIRYAQTGQRRWLVVSGLIGGLSFLTKIQGLVVLPAVGAILLLRERSRDTNASALWLSLARSFALWSLAAVLVWLVLWPALWVRPLEVLGLVFSYTARKAGSEGVNLFFMGRHYYNEDPGMLFYPVVALLRITPLTVVGLALLLWQEIRTWRGRISPGRPRRPDASLALLTYIVLYTVAMTLGSHKQDRYLMPVFLALDILAATGWVYLWDRLVEHRPGLRAGSWVSVAFAGFLVLQSASVLPYHPYYFPYFNPLFGGAKAGVKTLRVGWGEGMDLVADYLNAKPDAARLNVAARWHQYMLGFSGKTVPFDETGRWTKADYVVLYIQQTQRMLDPSPGIIRYFQGREPEHIVRVNGVEYAQIYPSPFTRSAQPLVSELPEQAALFGFRLEMATPPADRMTSIKMIWENRGFTKPPLLVAALGDGTATPHWYPCETAPGFEHAAVTPGEVVESVCDLSLTADDLAADAFDLSFGLEDRDGHVYVFPFPEAQRSLIKDEDGLWRPATWLESLDQVVEDEVPGSATPADIYYQGQIRLAAYELSVTSLHPGQPLALTLYWQPLVPVREDYLVYNHLFGLQGTIVGEADEWPAVPTSQWLPGQVITTAHRMLTSADAPSPAVATLDIGLYDAERKALPATDRHGRPVPVTLTRLKIVPTTWPDQPPPRAREVLFEDGLLLAGHSELPAMLSLEEETELTLQLWWRALAPPQGNYSVFIHVLNATGEIVAQADGIPLEGRYPTSAWGAGEPIVDTRILVLPSDLSAGDYSLALGLYDPVDGSRLAVVGQGVDSVHLGQLTVSP